MAVLSSKGVERFTPEHYEGAAGAPVYLLSRPTFREKSQVLAELARCNLRPITDKEISDAIKEAIDSLDLDNGADLLLVVTEYQDMIAGTPLADAPTQEAGEADEVFQDRVKARDEEIARRNHIVGAYNEIGDLVRRVSPKVAGLLSDRSRYQTMLNPIMVSIYLRGWENVSAKFRRLGDMVPEDALEAIAPEDIGAIALKVGTMMSVSAAQRGN